MNGWGKTQSNLVNLSVWKGIQSLTSKVQLKSPHLLAAPPSGLVHKQLGPWTELSERQKMSH